MKTFLTFCLSLCLIQHSFAQPGVIYYVTSNGIRNSCKEPGCSGYNPIPFSLNSCRDNDSVSTPERWFILKPDSTSIRIKLTFNTQCNVNINDIDIYYGVFPKLFLISHSPISISGGLIDINSLVPGIPVYIRLMHGHDNRRNKNCDPSIVEYYNLCEKELKRPFETTKDGELIINGNGEFGVSNPMIEFYTDAFNMDIATNPNVKTAPIVKFFKPAYIDSIKSSLAKFGIDSNLLKEIQLDRNNFNMIAGDSMTSSRKGNYVNKTRNTFFSFQMELPPGILSKYNAQQICMIFSMLDCVRFSQPTDASARAN